MSTGTQTEVVMPQMGVSVSEGTITKWLKQPGDQVARDEPLLEISTDKVDTEVPSPGEGVVTQILVPEGETVEVGTVLALIGPAGSAPAEAPTRSRGGACTRGAPHFRARTGARRAGSCTSGSGSGTGRPLGSWEWEDLRLAGRRPHRLRARRRSFLRPGHRSRRAGDEEGHSRVHRVGRAARSGSRGSRAGGGRQPEPAAPAPAAPAPAAPAPPKAPEPAAAEPELAPGEQLEPMTAMRRGVMEHMRRSVDTAAHVTSAIEVDFARVVALRQTLKPELAKQGVNLTYLAFIARAAVDTLAEYPWINGEIRGQSIVTRPNINLGIAVALEEGKGLIVPVIRNAQDLNLQGTARAIQDIAERARTKKLLPDDVQGGTFTITNPGSFGTFHGTPIINQPQSAILGTYALVKRPWVIQDELGNDVIGIRPLMNLTLTYDHRLVDGAYAGMYLRDLRARLESWDEAAY